MSVWLAMRCASSASRFSEAGGDPRDERDMMWLGLAAWRILFAASVGPALKQLHRAGVRTVDDHRRSKRDRLRHRAAPRSQSRRRVARARSRADGEDATLDARGAGETAACLRARQPRRQAQHRKGAARPRPYRGDDRRRRQRRPRLARGGRRNRNGRKRRRRRPSGRRHRARDRRHGWRRRSHKTRPRHLRQYPQGASLSHIDNASETIAMLGAALVGGEPVDADATALAQSGDRRAAGDRART